MAKSSGSISHRNYHLLVASTFNLSLLIKILIEDKIFELEARYNAKETQFVDFFIYRITKIVARGLLKKYQCRVQGN